MLSGSKDAVERRRGLTTAEERTGCVRGEGIHQHEHDHVAGGSVEGQRDGDVACSSFPIPDARRTSQRPEDGAWAGRRVRAQRGCGRESYQTAS